MACFRYQNKFVGLFYFIVVMAGSLLSACSTFDISQGPPTDSAKHIDGIPFYTVAGRIVQTTKIVRTWVVVELTYSKLKEDGKTVDKSVVFSFNIQPKTFDKNALHAWFFEQSGVWKTKSTIDLDKFQKEVKNHLNCDKNTENKKNCLLDSSSLLKETSIPINAKKVENANITLLDESLLANQTQAITIPDYSKVYYFNSKVPLFGTADSHIDIGDDGTLTKASNNASMEKLADLIPLKEMLIDKWAGGPTRGQNLSGAASEISSYKFDLAIKKTGVLYVLTKIHKPAKGLSYPPLRLQQAMGGSVQIQVSRFESADSEPAKAKSSDGVAKKNKNAIKVSGTIEMP